MAGEYLTSNTAIAYPFAEDAPALGQGVFPVSVFADALITVPYELAGLTAYLRGYDAGVFTIGSTDEDWVTLTATPDAGPWTVTEVTDPVTGVTAAVVLDSQALAALIDTTHAPVDLGTLLPFEASAVSVDSAKVLSLRLYNEGPQGSYTTVTGNVTLKGGYNVVLAASDGAIEVAAAAGAGIGQAPCQESGETGPGAPLGVTPAKGNIQIVGDDCFEVIPLPSQGMFMIQGRCTACCTCDDYVDMHALLADMAQRLNTAKTVLDEARATYEEGVSYYHDTLIPSLQRVDLRVNGIRGPDWADGRGAPNWARLVLVFSNHRPIPVTLVQGWTVDFLAPSVSGTVTDVGWEYDGRSGKMAVGQRFTGIAPGMSLAITVEAQMTLVNWAVGRLWNIRISAETDAGDVLKKSLEIR